MGAKKLSFDFAINPLEESIAYETLMALQGMTEAKLEKKFPSIPDQHSLMPLTTPMEILQNKRQNGEKEAIDQLFPKVEKLIRAKSFSVCLQDTFHYPETLLAVHTAPPKLFYYRGDVSFLESPCVSVIGSREASPEGLKRAQRIAKLLVEQDFTVVSGLAKGIDTQALKTATQLGGRVIAVIGTPIDQCYPKENKDLQDEIAKNHLLMSHVPFYRYENETFNNHRFYFPKRNAVMSAISQASIIVEASDTSGTLSQAQAAIDQNKKLFILNSCFEKYEWPSKFEKKGAIKIKDEKDLFEHLNS